MGNVCQDQPVQRLEVINLTDIHSNRPQLENHR